ncbi:hypothetical protein [Yoonia sp. BS5-3]|uniref:Uncharacterized protein n=1 Tax=Yoonia phaeophyticola TaxID=3137369 RepID=A0ABZ2V055_9RHOB
MDVDEVRDRDSLRRYLDHLPQYERMEVARRVSFNSAFRVFPILALDLSEEEWAQQLNLSPLPFFGCLATAEAGGLRASASFSAAIRGVTCAANQLETEVAVKPQRDGNAASASNALPNAMFAAINAATFWRSHKTTDRMGSAIAAVVCATAASEHLDLWELIRADLVGNELIWPDGMPVGFEQTWQNATEVMRERPVDWSVWINWYNRILGARDWHPRAMWNVLQNMTPEDWKKGPEHINPMFDEVLALYLEEDQKRTGAPKSSQPIASQQILATRSAMIENRRQLPASFDAVIGLITLEIERLQRKNYQSDDERDEAKRQIGVLTSMHEAVLGLADLVPETDHMPQGDAEQAVGLVRLYLGKFKEWPRANVDELVDNTCRLGLVGATAVTLPLLGVSATVAATAGAVFFGGERILKNIKSAKDAIH